MIAIIIILTVISMILFIKMRRINKKLEESERLFKKWNITEREANWKKKMDIKQLIKTKDHGR